MGIQGDGRGVDVVAEWLEEPSKDRFTAPARDDGELYLERNLLIREFGPLFAATAHCRGEHLGQRHRHERRSGKGPVVDVLGEGEVAPPRPAMIAHKSHGVDSDDKGHGAFLVGCRRIEDVGRAEGQFRSVEPVRVLVQQVAEIGGRLMGRRECEDHDGVDAPPATKSPDFPEQSILGMIKKPLGQGTREIGECNSLRSTRPRKGRRDQVRHHPTDAHFLMRGPDA